MSRSRALTLLAIIVAGTAAIHAEAATLSLVGSSIKVCQLVGETDWASKQPTAARTLSNFGLDAVDLGFPVDSGTGPLYFLFGDALPNGHPPGIPPTVPPDDALGWTFRTALPDSKNCLDLKLATSAPRIFAHPTVHPPVQQGTFNVPSGGVYFDGKLYAFFWTAHCMFPGTLTPNPTAPLRLPRPGALCLQIPVNNSVGRSVVAVATAANPASFGLITSPGPWRLPQLPQMPSGFVYVTAANPPEQNSAVEAWPSGIPVFGVARYRASIPYLAIAPRQTFGNPNTWSFFAGNAGSSDHSTENPVWVTRQQWESGHNAAGEWMPPVGAEIYQAEPAGERCVGEHSVTWNAPLHAWLLLYNCAPWTVEARFAPEPWGPWSPPVVLLSAAHDPGIECTLIQSAAGCAGLRNYWKLPNGKPWPGIFYAPFVLNRFTRDATAAGAGQSRRTTIYWLLSTWNPYVVVVMQSTLELRE